jgi:hypothetical protein
VVNLKVAVLKQEAGQCGRFMDESVLPAGLASLRSANYLTVRSKKLIVSMVSKHKALGQAPNLRPLKGHNVRQPVH